MSLPFVTPLAVTPPIAKEEQDTEDLKQVFLHSISILGRLLQFHLDAKHAGLCDTFHSC